MKSNQKFSFSLYFQCPKSHQCLKSLTEIIPLALTVEELSKIGLMMCQKLRFWLPITEAFQKRPVYGFIVCIGDERFLDVKQGFFFFTSFLLEKVLVTNEHNLWSFLSCSFKACQTTDNNRERVVLNYSGENVIRYFHPPLRPRVFEKTSQLQARLKNKNKIK